MALTVSQLIGKFDGGLENHARILFKVLRGKQAEEEKRKSAEKERRKAESIAKREREALEKRRKEEQASLGVRI